MKYLVFLLMSVSGYCQNIDEQIAAFERENSEFELETYSNEQVLKRVEEDMRLACQENGLCTLTGISNNNHEFSATFQVGFGNPLFQGYGGNGTTVVVPGNNNNSQSTAPFMGLQVSFTHSNCTQEIQVPKSVYLALNRYMYGLLKEDGDIQRSFDPAKEAMIMFYTTIISKLSSCQ